MARKKKKSEEETAVEIAATALLDIAWKLSVVHAVCPICLVFCASEMVQKAMDRGYIDHGVLTAQDPDALNTVGETMQ